MNWREFVDKYDLDRVSPFELAGFISVMDYLYISKTKKQTIALMVDFYDHADDIFNSMQEDRQKLIENFDNLIKNMVDAGLITEDDLKELQNELDQIEDDDTSHYDA